MDNFELNSYSNSPIFIDGKYFLIFVITVAYTVYYFSKVIVILKLEWNKVESIRRLFAIMMEILRRYACKFNL